MRDIILSRKNFSIDELDSRASSDTTRIVCYFDRYKLMPIQSLYS